MSEFSVLLPVYRGDHAQNFVDAVRSVTAEQILRPSELVVVCDGPVPPDIDSILDSLDLLADGVPCRVVRIPKNVGLAIALGIGLSHCAYEIVARADADDISEPERFALSLPRLVDGNLDMVGTAIREFDSKGLGVVRVMPETAGDIVQGAKFRDPFNHPTAVYRKSAVADAGGYEHLNKMEDYWLFVRMLHRGARVANLPEPLVRYRVDEGAYQRRGGVSMLVAEWDLQVKMRTLGYIGTAAFLRNVAVRCGYRLVPTAIRRRAYRGSSGSGVRGGVIASVW